MSGCCSGENRVRVEVEYLDVDGETCERCAGTRDHAREAVVRAQAHLAPMNVVVEIAERKLGSSAVDRSNRVLVEGRLVEDWLGGSAGVSECPSCADLLGADSVCCRDVEIAGVRSESVGADAVFDAIMMAAGLDSGARAVGGPGVAGATVADALEVTIVTEPGCG